MILFQFDARGLKMEKGKDEKRVFNFVYSRILNFAN